MGSAFEAGVEGDVHVIAMREGENRFNPDSLAALEEILDRIEAVDGDAAAVITGEGKFFSNGLDLDWMGGAPEGGAQEVIERTQRLLSRLLVFPRPLIAAINGHCFAAGAMAALACDGRVMRADRGFFCLPEVDIGMTFTPGMSALVGARLSPQTAHEAMLTGRRYGGEQALEAGIVDAVANEDAVVATAVERAAGLAAKNPETVGGIKQRLYSGVVERLHEPLFP